MKKVLRKLSIIVVTCCIVFAFTACTPKTEHEKITAAYAKLRKVNQSEVRMTCCAEFNGAHVLIIHWRYDGFDDMVFTETVDGVDFVHPVIRTFDVYRNGKFYSLQEAFDRGFVTHDDLLTLRDKYNS